MSEVKGKPITKEMWEDIEAEMSGSWVDIHFGYQGYEISVCRVRVSESKTCLQVYIDGVINGSWTKVDLDAGGDLIADHAPKCLTDVWGKMTRARYAPSKIKKLQKIWGKREFKKMYPDADKKYVFHVPNFSKASVLCRQFKKLEGLELKKAMFLDLKEETL